MKCPAAFRGANDGAAAAYDILTYGLKLPEEDAGDILDFIFPEILEGWPLSFVMESLLYTLPAEPELPEFCELWCAVAGMLLGLELPMLKGRSRLQYAEEKKISAWDIDMVGEEKKDVHAKERHMYEFGPSIQEAMFRAVKTYLKKEQIRSEEFFYLLAKANIIGSRFQEADALIRQLGKSSPRGKKGAEVLREMLKWGIVMADEPEEGRGLFRGNGMPPISQTYVRNAPKIGRNDPCPCGSGKKYKKCCGKS